MSVFDHPEFDHHEAIHFFEEPAAGFKAIIAVHSTALGPAAGGCRRWSYANDGDALTDVLRLSRGMSYKNAVAGLPFGGGKSVILANDDSNKSTELFRAFGRAVESLGGRYITAEDVGVTVNDMRIAREETAHISGLPQSGDCAGGDPSPWTAFGVFLGIRAAAEARFGSDSLEGLTVAVQGVGNVGFHLCKLLADAGAKLVVADVSRRNMRKAGNTFSLVELPATEILYSEVDILAPCALGNVLNAETIPRLRAKVVAGAANNQLSNESDGERLAKRGILYAPDYVINAGGVISVAREYLGQSTEDEVRTEINRIPERLQTIFAQAESSGRPTNRIADELAQQLVANAEVNVSPGDNARRIA